MTDHQDDGMDEMLRAAARDYNPPGEAPRDRMWAAIHARRSARPSQAAPPRVMPIRHRTWLAPLAAAAVLVLGIAIGRLYERLSSTPKPRITAVMMPDSATNRLAVAPQTDSPQHLDSIQTRAPEPTASAPGAARTTRTAQPSIVDRPPSAAFTPGSTNLAYRLAIVEHLAGTEAMLTSFRAEAKRGDVDAQMTAWARNLLTTTRLLQASAAQQDPTMKRLLDDLELVLVQIAQYTSAGPHRAEELELIEHSIARRGVIGKLQTIPARLVPAGS